MIKSAFMVSCLSTVAVGTFMLILGGSLWGCLLIVGGLCAMSMGGEG